MANKLLIVQAAALGYDFLTRNIAEEWEGLTFRPAESVFPAVTCTVQASFRTASPPSRHGMVANGLFHRDLCRPMFWEQSARLVRGPRIWEGFRRRGGKVAMLFWQQCLGEDVDAVLSPAPIHKHHGGMIQDCYGQPDALYARLCDAVGRPFNLKHYWGPMASPKVGEWISSAAAALLADAELAPDLCLAYLPTLDYDPQRFGPQSAASARSLQALLKQLADLVHAAGEHGYEVLIFGDYAIAPVSQAALPNKALLEAGLMRARRVRQMLYPDFHTSRAFAVVDHQVAHVYVKDPSDAPPARDVLAALPGVAEVLDRQAQAAMGLDHPNSGELVVVAEEGRWLAYPWWDPSPWWSPKRPAPEYAGHVDIHNKPGYDPCELFFGHLPMWVSQEHGRIRGSHGRIGPGKRIAWATTLPLPAGIANLIGLAAAVRDWLDGGTGFKSASRPVESPLATGESLHDPHSGIRRGEPVPPTTQV